MLFKTSLFLMMSYYKNKDDFFDRILPRRLAVLSADWQLHCAPRVWYSKFWVFFVLFWIISNHLWLKGRRNAKKVEYLRFLPYLFSKIHTNVTHFLSVSWPNLLKKLSVVSVKNNSVIPSLLFESIVLTEWTLSIH